MINEQSVATLSFDRSWYAMLILFRNCEAVTNCRGKEIYGSSLFLLPHFSAFVVGGVQGRVQARVGVQSVQQFLPEIANYVVILSHLVY